MPTLKMSTVDLHYLVAGSGRTNVVLLHGWCDDARTFQPLIELLTTEFRCIAPDMRGHGGSGLPHDNTYSLEALSNDVAALCEAEGVTNALFVGHSFGACLATTVAARHASLVARMLLLDQSFDLPALASQLRPLEATIRSPQSHLDFRKSFLSGLIGNVAAPLRARLDEAIDRTPVGVALGLWAPLFEWNSREVQRSADEMLEAAARVSTRIIDRERVPAYHDRIAHHFPRVAIEILGGSHWLHLEHTQRIADAIRALAAETQVAA